MKRQALMVACTLATLSFSGAPLLAQWGPFTGNTGSTVQVDGGKPMSGNMGKRSVKIELTPGDPAKLVYIVVKGTIPKTNGSPYQARGKIVGSKEDHFNTNYSLPNGFFSAQGNLVRITIKVKCEKDGDDCVISLVKQTVGNQKKEVKVEYKIGTGAYKQAGFGVAAKTEMAKGNPAVAHFLILDSKGRRAAYLLFTCQKVDKKHPVGVPTGFESDVTTATGNTGCLGVAYTYLNGQSRYWVTARSPILQRGMPHMLYELDGQGKLVASYPQPTAYQMPSGWGLRDLAFDGRYLYAGQERVSGTATAYAFDVVTRSWDSTKNIVLPNFPTSTLRALAFDPGSETFWTSNFSSDAYEFNRSGQVLRKVSTGASSTYGAGFDPVQRLLYLFGQNGSKMPGNPGVVGSVYDPDRGVATGIAFLGDQSVAGSRPGGIAGGMHVYRRADNTLAILCLSQANKDTIYELGGPFEFGASCAGGSGDVPGIAMNGDVPFAGNLNWQLRLRGARGAAGAILFVGLDADSFMGRSLPLELTFMGLPGCHANINLLVPMGVAQVSSSGTAAVGVPLPNAVSLRGLTTYWQWVVQDPTASNSLKTTVSRGGKTILY